MSQRITRAMLDRKVEALNAATGQPLTYFAGDSRETSIGGYVSMRALYEQIACAVEVIRTVKG